MTYGAGVVAAKQAGAAEIVDPQPYAVGSIAETYAKYPNAGGHPPRDGLRRRADRRARGDDPRTPCDVVVVGTPIDLTRVLKIAKPAVRAHYELQEVAPGRLAAEIERAVPAVVAAPR